jgi:hypothetical protein
MFTINNKVFANRGYYINLDSSVDRKEQVEGLIIDFKISGLNRFTALQDSFIQFSCTKSHLSVFQDASNNDLDVIFVAEDDFFISEFLHTPYSEEKVTFFETIDKVYEDLQNVDWDIIQFGCNPKAHLVPITNNLARNYSSTGAWAYLIKKDAYRYILQNSNYVRDYIAIDDYLPMMSKLGFVTLTTIPMSISHSVGFISTLQPRGPVNYDSWINGSYDKFLYGHYKNRKFMDESVEKDTTVVIAGHQCENYMYYLKYLLHSLPDELLRCRFIVHYDETSGDPNLEKMKLSAFFRDNKSELNVTLSSSYGGLIASIEKILEQVTTPYYIFLEHDWVFLKKDSINFTNLVRAFNNHNFINAVWFAKDNNIMRGFEIARDIDDNSTPFEKEERVNEVDLITTIRFSNNPVMFRTDKMKEWYYEIIKNQHVGIIHQSQQNVEETMIPHIRDVISKNRWEDVKDNWGSYLYGKLEEGPYVGHTDASKRYQGAAKSGPEYNGEEYIKNNPL